MKLKDNLTELPIPPPAPRFADEADRLRIVKSFDLDALQDDPELARIVAFAAKLCDVPVSQVSMIEEARQRFLAGEGLDVTETPREVAFCAHTMVEGEIMEVRDAAEDLRFRDNALVTGAPHVRFYAGHPLVSREGAPLGALCVIDSKPRPEGLTEFQREGLAVLAQAVMRRLRARRADLLAQSQLAQQSELLRRTIEGVPQIAWSADSDGNFDYFNARWTEFTGAPPPRVTDDWRPFIHPEDSEHAFGEWARSFAAGQEFEAEYRLKDAEGDWVWVLGQAMPVAEEADGTVRWFGTITDIDEVRKALDERDMLAKELSHRIKNIFAVVIGLASLKVRKTPEHQPFATELIEVLHALGRAHDVVRAGGPNEHESLLGLLEALFSPYVGPDKSPRVKISGADAPISSKAATPLALVFHELATNSAKYGALSVDDGHVDLTLNDQGDTVLLVWQETGGPAVSPEAGDAARAGFGSRLVEMSVSGQLGGTWERDFAAEGLVARLTVAKAALSG